MPEPFIAPPRRVLQQLQVGAPVVPLMPSPTFTPVVHSPAAQTMPQVQFPQPMITTVLPPHPIVGTQVPFQQPATMPPPQNPVRLPIPPHDGPLGSVCQRRSPSAPPRRFQPRRAQSSYEESESTPSGPIAIATRPPSVGMVPPLPPPQVPLVQAPIQVHPPHFPPCLNDTKSPGTTPPATTATITTTSTTSTAYGCHHTTSNSTAAASSAWSFSCAWSGSCSNTRN
jgi:hypothetical protein